MEGFTWHRNCKKQCSVGCDATAEKTKRKAVEKIKKMRFF